MAQLDKLLIEITAKTDGLKAALDEMDRRMATSTQRSTAAVQRLGGAVANENRRVGVDMANLSHQIQDIGTQLASGTSPFVVLVQQGPHVLHALGGVSESLRLAREGLTALGAVIAAHPITALAGAAAAAAVAFLLLADHTDTTEKAMTAYQKAVDESNKLLKTQVELTREAAEAKRKEALETVKLAEAEIQAYRARLVSSQETTGKLLSTVQRNRQQGRLTGANGQEVELRLQMQTRIIEKLIADADKRLADLNARRDGLNNPRAESVLGQQLGGGGSRKAADDLKDIGELVRDGDLAAEIEEVGAALEESLAAGEAAWAPLEKMFEEGRRLAERTRTPFEEYADTLKRLQELYSVGAIDVETYGRAAEEAARRLENAGEQSKGLKDAANDLGYTFSSAFEDAILSGQKLSEVLQGLAEDIARVMIRRAITEPIGNAISGAISGAFGGPVPAGAALGGPVAAGVPYLVGEHGREMFVPRTAGSIVPSNKLGGPRVTVQMTNHFGVGVNQAARAEIMSLMPQLNAAAVAAVERAQRRSGGTRF